MPRFPWAVVVPGLIACSDSTPTDAPLSTGDPIHTEAPSFAPPAAPGAASSPGETIFGIDADNNLLSFGANRPGQVTHADAGDRPGARRAHRRNRLPAERPER